MLRRVKHMSGLAKDSENAKVWTAGFYPTLVRGVGWMEVALEVAEMR